MDEALDFAQVCKDIEDHLVPYLRLGSGERAMYYHLLRHSRAEGKRVALISNRRLGSSFGTSSTTARFHLRHLAEKGCIRITDRSLAGHTLDVLLPHEIPGCLQPDSAPKLEHLASADCFHDRKLRPAILRRENNACFYCLRELRPESAAFDHVVPVSVGSDHSFRNVVACCFDCNSRKRNRPAAEFLRELYRTARLSDDELDARLIVLETLQSGQLVPAR
ncbi:MAG: HNH endonuclease [Acidobacteria bacterium]|nr:HNH endonuclease [Acidobacteriota bacterium]